LWEATRFPEQKPGCTAPNGGSPMNRQGTIVGLCLAAFLAGCASPSDPPEVFPVRGKVVQADGSPVGAGTITFHAKDYPGNDALALIQKDGSFALGTFAKEDGAVPGRYVATVAPFGKKGSAVNIPKKYQNEDSSPLNVEVKAEQNVLEPFRLR
jgi:hypothetical protein